MDELTVHTLRKCAGQNWADYMPVNVVKELAGHSNIETINRFYSTVDEEHLKVAVKIGDELLTTDLKLTFPTISEENQKCMSSAKMRQICLCIRRRFQPMLL